MTKNKICKYYKDFYGSTASIKERAGYFHMVCRNSYGEIIKKGKYDTFRGARIALGKISDLWSEKK